MSFASFAHRVRARNIRRGMKPAYPITDPSEGFWEYLAREDLFAREA